MAGVDVGTAYLTVVPSAKGFSANLSREISGGMDKAGRDAGATASKGFGGAFKSGLATVAKAGALGLAAVFAGGVAFAKDAIGEARESQKVGAVTTQIIKATGGAAKISADQVGELATAISNKSGMDDEAIQSGANLLLTFKNVKNEVGEGANVFDRATQAAVDLSAAGFGDVAGASKMLGKALNDPVAGMSALGRAGVTFSDQQKEQIKTLVESGKTLDAQKIILKEVESQVGGTAAASATAGEKMSTSFGNLKEQIGTALLPVLDKVEGWFNDKAIPAVSKFIDEFQKGEGTGGKFRDILEDIGAAVGEVVDKGKKLVDWLRDNETAVKAAAVAVGLLVLATEAHAAALAVQGAGGLVAYIKNIRLVSAVTKAWAAVQWLMNIALNANPIGLIVIAVAALVAGIIWVATQTTFFQDTWKLMTDALAAAWRWLWNSILAPIIRWILEGFAKLTDGIAFFLDQLGNIPGFGWAKDAADKMKDAAKKARDLAQGIKDIPEKANVKVRIEYVTVNKPPPLTDSRLLSMDKWVARAHGGPVSAGGMYAVGDNPDGSWNSTTELFVPNQSGTILNQDQLAALGGGGDLSDRTIEKLGFAISRVQVRGVISAAEIDRATSSRGSW